MSYVLAKASAPIGLAFYLWLGIFNVLVVSNFWSFANDLYTEEQGKRLFAIDRRRREHRRDRRRVRAARCCTALLGIDALMLVAAAGSAVSIVLYRIVDRRERARTTRRKAEPRKRRARSTQRRLRARDQGSLPARARGDAAGRDDHQHDRRVCRSARWRPDREQDLRGRARRRPRRRRTTPDVAPRRQGDRSERAQDEYIS